MKSVAEFHRVRPAALIIHRWVGLTLAIFLVIVGLSGSLIAFNDEIEGWLAPELFLVTPPSPTATPLGPFELRDKVAAAYPGAYVDWVELGSQPGRSAAFGLEPSSQLSADADQAFIDPFSGRILGERIQGDLFQGKKNLMPFIYSLHVSLAAGEWGTTVLGVAALLWTLDCFVGAYLTFPLRRREQSGGRRARRTALEWSGSWAKAWKIRMTLSPAKLIFDLHRAAGLWTWALLAILAWSGVGFNLRPVYEPVMQHATAYQPQTLPARAIPSVTAAPKLSWSKARVAASEVLQQQAHIRGFRILRERLIHYDRNRRLYEYRTLSTLDVGDKQGNTTVFIDADTGSLVYLSLPRGQSFGNAVDAWFAAIHTATWGGLPMQIIICVTGVVVAGLSVSGVWLWWRRRSGRRAKK